MNKTSSVSFDELSFANQLLLWSIRIWVRGYQLRRSVEERLFDTFIKVRMPGAVGLLDRIMKTIVIGHSRSVEIRGLGCNLVSDDERTFLYVVASYQTGNPIKPWFSLCRFLQPEAAQQVGHLLEQLINLNTSVGLVFSKFPGESSGRLHLPTDVIPATLSTRVH